MQSKSLILLVFALGCGVVASIGITRVMANRSDTPAPQDVETQPVFVIKSEVPLGAVLDAEKLKLEQWPKGKVPEGALSNLEDIEGRRARTKLFAGEPVLEVKLLSQGESAGGAAIQIPQGYRSVPVKVDDVSGGAAMILPGDRVDVLVYVQAGKSGFRTTMTKTILQDIKIFAVDATWTLEADDGGGKSIRAKTISLLLTPDQTERVMLAAELGKIRLALRSPTDREEAELSDEGHQIGQILGDAQVADREKDSFLGSRDLLQAQLPTPMAMNVMEPERPSHTVRVISGSQVQEVVMQSQSEESDVNPSGETNSTSGSATSFLWKIISSPSTMMGDKGAAKNPNPDMDLKPGASSEGAPNLNLDIKPAEPEDTRSPVVDN